MAGKLIIVSGLSGSGKTTLVDHALATFPNAAKVISCTTRAKRENEQDGVHYHFFTREEFKARIKRGEFAEYKPNVYGNMYGTRKEDITEACAAHSAVILVVDIQGVRTLSTLYPEAKTFYIYSKAAELSERLRERKTSPEDIRKRMATVKREQKMALEQNFDHIIDNDNGKLEAAKKMFCFYLKRAVKQLRSG